MKNKYPDFSKDWLEDLFITSPLEAMKVAREMEKFEETAQKDAEIIQDWQTNHLDYNWKEGLSAIDIIKDELSERDITLEELGLTNERIINVLSSMGINGQKNSLEENLALALFFDDNGNLDKSVHQPLYGKDKVRPDFLVRKFLNSSKEAIKRVKEEKRFNIENNAKKQGFKDASSKKPAPLLSSTSGGIGTMPKPAPMKSVSQLGDDELEIALRKAEKSQY
jgi:arginine/lysine/ornithine decarboxylase